MTAENTTELNDQGQLPLAQALLLPRIAIENTMPIIDGGQFAVKAVAGQDVVVTSKVFADGHDKLAVRVRWQAAGSETWHSAALDELGNNGWQGSFPVPQPGRYVFFIEAWIDQFASFRYELEKKHTAGVPVSLELQEGRSHVLHAAERSEGQLSEDLAALHHQLGGLLETEQVALFLHQRSADLMSQADHRPYLSLSPEYPLDVERELAQFASWYELFPRSITDDKARHGTFNDVHSRLAMIQDMGFDVLYFPPIHPIGRSHRKGPNNSLTAGPNDPGSPYAIGSSEGGHEAIHPELGSRDDFRRLVAAAADHGLEIALDFAIQCSQDHPWLQQHPGWFNWRPDGTIKYAENPPKKYQDIVNVDFYAADAIPSLWVELRDIVVGWVEEGVKIFRVDNPHTKPLQFWEWLLHEVNTEHPEVVFLAEAFTAPAMMYSLGQAGFQQSYTYFTWRNTKLELEEFLTGISHETDAFFRPNLFVNTPDILTAYLQFGGIAAYKIRAAIAATASPSWGVYAGYELFENVARPGSEENIDNEKYEYKARDFAAAEAADRSLAPYLTRLNEIRNAHPALQQLRNLDVHWSDDDSILVYSKYLAREFAGGESADAIIVVANLDPHSVRETSVHLDLTKIGLEPGTPFSVTDLITGGTYEWSTDNYVRLDAFTEPVHILHVDFSKGI